MDKLEVGKLLAAHGKQPNGPGKCLFCEVPMVVTRHGKRGGDLCGACMTKQGGEVAMKALNMGMSFFGKK